MRGLCLVTDRPLCGGRDLAWVVAEAVRGGVTSVQLREKEASTKAFLQQAQELKALLAGAGVPLIINDRVDIALAVQAEGVHLGQSDLPPAVARKLLGPQAFLGLSVETWDDVLDAQNEPVDYLGVSPVFSTPTKTDTLAAWGLEGLRRIREHTRLPLVAIGGIHPANIRDIVTAGADGIAVVSALCAAPAPCAAAQELCRRGWPEFA